MGAPEGYSGAGSLALPWPKTALFHRRPRRARRATEGGQAGRIQGFAVAAGQQLLAPKLGLGFNAQARHQAVLAKVVEDAPLQLAHAGSQGCAVALGQQQRQLTRFGAVESVALGRLGLEAFTGAARVARRGPCSARPARFNA